MPALFALGQRPALREVQRQLAPNEYLMAFLDDIYVAVTPQRVRPVCDLLATHLHHHARIHPNQGKTRVWNAAGAEPPNIASLGPDVWVGNPHLPTTHQGLTALGAPVGSPMFVQHQLRHTPHTHQQLLQRIPTLDDLQASWLLLLLFCASPRSTYLLRMCAPDSTKDFAEARDTAVGACLQSLLQTTDIPATSLAIAHTRRSRPHVSNNSRSFRHFPPTGRHGPRLSVSFRPTCPSSPTTSLNNSPILKHLRRSKPQRTLREP